MKDVNAPPRPTPYHLRHGFKVNAHELSDACATAYRAEEKIVAIVKHSHHDGNKGPLHVIETHIKTFHHILSSMEPTHSMDHVSVNLQHLKDAEHQVHGSFEALTHYPHKDRHIHELLIEIRKLDKLCKDMLGQHSKKAPQVPPRRK